jgi:2-polyprenyl-3-methyl-5-hydroxy-6-metoxy-1,4-benzoquinol methylase
MEMAHESASEIHTRPSPDCLLCRARGEPLYQALRDRLSVVPGQWQVKRCPDPTCGLLWLDPMPVEEDIGRAYREYYTHARAERQNLVYRIFSIIRDGYVSRRYGYACTRWRRWLAPLIYLYPGARAEADYGVAFQPAPGPGARLLDVGCGGGVALERLDALGWHAEGLEVDARAVEAARMRGLTVHHGTLAAQGYADSSFDVLTMSHVLEHVHDPVELLRECFRILKPQGQLVVLTPNSESRGHLSFRGAWFGLEPPRHLHLFNQQNLKTTLMRSGPWSIDSLRTTVRGAHTIWLGSRSIRNTGKATLEHTNTREQLASHAFCYGEWAAMKFRPARGEELLLLATRQS